MDILKRYSALFLLIVFMGGYSELSRAEQYYWVGTRSGVPGYLMEFSTAEAACDYFHSAYADSTLINTKTRKDTLVNESLMRCSFLYYSSTRQDFQRTVCPVDSDKPACLPEPDKCEATIGALIYHEFRFASIGEDGNPSTDPPITVCKDGCQYSHTFGNFSSKRDFGPPDQLVGSFEYKGNGTSCTASATDPSVFDQPPSKDPVKNAPEYATSNNCDNWVTQEDGTLKRSCTAKTSYKNEGDVDCSGGTTGSGFSSSVTCTPSKNNPPEKTQTDVEQETTKKENSDGSTETNTKTDTTKTECKGTKPCTSTSKTETMSEKTDADGNTTQSGNCTGDDCNPDKSEDGTEDDEDSEEGEERTASVGDCDGSFSCTGDPIDCAILKQQKEQQCYAEEMGDFEGKKSDVEGLFQGDDFKLNEGDGDIDVPSFVTQGTRFLSPSCPPDRVVSLSMAGRTVGISFQPLCNFASGLGPFLVAVTAVFCALYVGRSVGGN